MNEWTDDCWTDRNVIWFVGHFSGVSPTEYLYLFCPCSSDRTMRWCFKAWPLSRRSITSSAWPQRDWETVSVTWNLLPKLRWGGKKNTSYQTLTDKHLLNIDILESCHSDPSVLPRLSTRVHLSRLFKTTTKQKLQLQVQNMADSHLQWYRVTCGGVDPVWPGPKHIKQTRFMGSVGGIGLLSAPVLSKDWLWIQWWIKRCDVEQKWSRWHRCNCLLSHQPSVTVCFL